MNRKILTAALLAVCCSLYNTQPAAAWHRVKFSMYINFSIEKANTSFLWGLFKNGPGGPSSCEESGGTDGNFGGGMAAAPSAQAMNSPYSRDSYAYGYGYGMPQAYPAMNQLNNGYNNAASIQQANYSNYYQPQAAGYNYNYYYGNGYNAYNGYYGSYYGPQSYNPQNGYYSPYGR